MKQLIFSILYALLLFTACNSPEPVPPLQITGYRLTSISPATLADWYRSNLGFDIQQRDGSVVLKKVDFSIELEKSVNHELPIASGKMQPGFFKFGFKTPNLDLLFKKLEANNREFSDDIFQDDLLNMRSLVTRDADGNRVQFFEDKTVGSLQPYFFSIMALDFEQTKSWVESELGLVEIHNLDLPERGLLIRLMEKDNTLLELISDLNMDNTSEPLPGIQGIVFNRTRQGHQERELRYKGL